MSPSVERLGRWFEPPRHARTGWACKICNGFIPRNATAVHGIPPTLGADPFDALAPVKAIPDDASEITDEQRAKLDDPVLDGLRYQEPEKLSPAEAPIDDEGATAIDEVEHPDTPF